MPWRRNRLPTPVFLGFPCGSVGKEFTCNVRDLGSVPGLGRSPGEGKGATDSSILAWRIPQEWTLQSMRSQRFRHDFHFHFSLFSWHISNCKKKKKERKEKILKNYIMKYHSFVTIKIANKSQKHYTLNQDHDFGIWMVTGLIWIPWDTNDKEHIYKMASKWSILRFVSAGVPLNTCDTRIQEVL